MIKAEIEDVHGARCSFTIFPDRWEKVLEGIKRYSKGKFVFEEGIAIHFSGSANLYEDDMGLVLDDVFTITPPPQLPPDLKAKKVSLKESKKAVEGSLNELTVDQIFEEIEDSLVEEGFIDTEDDD